MKYTSIVTPNDLARYADTRESEGVIPELIYLLIKQSAPDIRECRIPYGDAVNQPGMDGLVDCETGFFEFVPAGKSYWEIGTGKDPQEKASSDFQKRTNELSDEERADLLSSSLPHAQLRRMVGMSQNRGLGSKGGKVKDGNEL